MGLVLDTSLLIAAERNRFDLPGFLRDHASDEIAVSAITASELLHGVERAQDATTRKERERFVEAILSRIPIIPFDLGQARQHARIWADLARRGEAVGAHDMLIAATALSLQAPLATLNRTEFQHIPGLRLLKVEKFQTRR
jgi:tRNA(fMet)-specific endonuclease VapC